MMIIDGENYYIFKEKRDVQFCTDILGCEFEHEWLKIQKNGVITVRGSNPGKDGYAWNGCSPKFGILDIVIGTPDGVVNLKTGKPKTYYASMIHDVLYQFSKHYRKQIKRKQADRLFLREMGNFRPRYVYYVAVRLFGGSEWGKCDR